MFKDFNQILIGDSASIKKTITEIDVRKFVEMTGDDNPLHVDFTFAKTTSFKDIVVHGMLGASFISTIIGTRLPGAGALWVSQSFDFLLPVRLGDELLISCTVIKKRTRERLLELDTKITNQRLEIVLSGTGKVKVMGAKPAVEISRTESQSKVAIITGGAGGIGAAISTALANAGYSIVVAYDGRAERANTLVNELLSKGQQAVAISADISTREGVDHLYDNTINIFGTVGVLVNNASPPIDPKSFEATEWEDIQKQLNIQLRGAFMLSKACSTKMIEQRWGRVINITSQVVQGQPTVAWMSYAIAKTSLDKFSKYLAAELGPNGITVNCISPGMCETGFIGNISEKQQLILARQTPTRRLSLPQDIANAVVFLASDGAQQINGQTIPVNGGIVMS
jgi:3-oxoacyl-[acyl-carrier protein] reductase